MVKVIAERSSVGLQKPRGQMDSMAETHTVRRLEQSTLLRFFLLVCVCVSFRLRCCFYHETEPSDLPRQARDKPQKDSSTRKN